MGTWQGQPTKQGCISNSYFRHIVLCCYPWKYWLKLVYLTTALCLSSPLQWGQSSPCFHYKELLSTEGKGSSSDFKDNIYLDKKFQKHLAWVYADQICLCFNTAYQHAKWELQDNCIKLVINIHTKYVVWKDFMITFLIFKQLEQNWDQLHECLCLSMSVCSCVNRNKNIFFLSMVLQISIDMLSLSQQ